MARLKGRPNHGKLKHYPGWRTPPKHTPTKKQIAERIAEIQDGWSESTRQARAVSNEHPSWQVPTDKLNVIARGAEGEPMNANRLFGKLKLSTTTSPMSHSPEIPAAKRATIKLSDQQITVLVTIYNSVTEVTELEKSKLIVPHCVLGTATLCGTLAMSPRSVSRSAHRLRAKGYIKPRRAFSKGYCELTDKGIEFVESLQGAQFVPPEDAIAMKFYGSSRRRTKDGSTH